MRGYKKPTGRECGHGYAYRANCLECTHEQLAAIRARLALAERVAVAAKRLEADPGWYEPEHHFNVLLMAEFRAALAAWKEGGET